MNNKILSKLKELNSTDFKDLDWHASSIGEYKLVDNLDKIYEIYMKNPKANYYRIKNSFGNKYENFKEVFDFDEKSIKLKKKYIEYIEYNKKVKEEEKKRTRTITIPPPPPGMIYNRNISMGWNATLTSSSGLELGSIIAGPPLIFFRYS
jgi:hypothetical protein